MVARTKETKQSRRRVDGPVTFETGRQFARAMDQAEESTSYGTPAFKVRGNLFARLHQDGESLVVRIGFDEREELIAADPDTYYITDHYLNYTWVLVRLARAHPDALRNLLRVASRTAA